MDVSNLFCLQNVEGRNFIHAIMRYKWETYLILGNLSVEIRKLLYLFIFTGLLSAATKLHIRIRIRIRIVTGDTFK